jgi:phospholipase C
VCSGGKHCVSGTCQASKIEHVVLIVQENHTFDSYFGRYCQALAGSNPVCTAGRTCCEGPPIDPVTNIYTDPSGAQAHDLDDGTSGYANFAGGPVDTGNDRDHEQVCELQQIHRDPVTGTAAMDRFVTGSTGSSTCLTYGPSCASTFNWVIADGTLPTDTVYSYWWYAEHYALADRYFQPIAGGTASNNMYFAGAHFRFKDNDRMPGVAVGTSYSKPNRLCTEETSPCTPSNTRATYPLQTIAGLLLDHGKTFGVYADGYSGALAAAATATCPDPATTAADCPYSDCSAHSIACHGCVYDPSDIPFLFYQRFGDTPVAGGVAPTPYVKDYTSLQTDITNQTLPAFSFVKARLFHNEHPNVSTIRDGENFVVSTANMIVTSPTYQNNTLILVTWDEGGGFYDHVAPPADPPINVDADDSLPIAKTVPYGTRVPFLAIGTFAKTGTVSHVQMEHSSVVKFLEWNFLTQVGQLNARDAWVNNIGSLLDPSKTGVPVP